MDNNQLLIGLVVVIGVGYMISQSGKKEKPRFTGSGYADEDIQAQLREIHREETPLRAAPQLSAEELMAVQLYDEISRAHEHWVLNMERKGFNLCREQ